MIFLKLSFKFIFNNANILLTFNKLIGVFN